MVKKKHPNNIQIISPVQENQKQKTAILFFLLVFDWSHIDNHILQGPSPLSQEAEDKSPHHRGISSFSPAPNSPTPSHSAAKRKVKSNSAIELNSGSQQTLMMMAGQHGVLPQQMQQLLQQQNQGLTAQQLQQQMMQHQTAMLQHQV